MRVGFTSRWIAEEADGRPDVSVISITDPRQAPAALKPGWRAVLRIAFHDVKRELPPYTAFSREHAREIARWILDGDHPAILVHCEAGVARSAGIAMAIREAFGLPPFPPDEVSAHNPLVRALLLEELRRALPHPPIPDDETHGEPRP